MTYNSPQVEAYMVLGQELFRHIYADAGPEELHNWLMTQLARLGSGDENARLLWPDSFTLYDEIIAERTRQASIPANERHIPTWPWDTWRNFIDPLDAGMLGVISGADGVGKTIYAENLAEHWAATGLNVAFVHFELNRSLMLDRRMARQTGIQRRVLKTGTLDAAQQSAYENANDRLRQWPGSITYIHTPGWTMERVVNEVRALVTEGICDIFVVDYLEKAAASERQLKTYGSNPFAREADNVELLKTAAESLERPAILLAQMNKAGKTQGFDTLNRTAIRGAGEKTEKANLVVLLHKESTESNLIQVRVDKNTMGRCGTFDQFITGARFQITDIYNASAL